MNPPITLNQQLALQRLMDRQKMLVIACNTKYEIGDIVNTCFLKQEGEVYAIPSMKVIGPATIFEYRNQFALDMSINTNYNFFYKAIIE